MTSKTSPTKSQSKKASGDGSEGQDRGPEARTRNFPGQTPASRPTLQLESPTRRTINYPISCSSHRCHPPLPNYLLANRLSSTIQCWLMTRAAARAYIHIHRRLPPRQEVMTATLTHYRLIELCVRTSHHGLSELECADLVCAAVSTCPTSNSCPAHGHASPRADLQYSKPVQTLPTAQASCVAIVLGKASGSTSPQHGCAVLYNLTARWLFVSG